ncbi:hypothetical protein HNR42_002941 [Deinobacterium chartae]|uniref:SbsA Ig-like domain-containing protein n=1 Tax=Deinobacterium chartae TaxID=521158 RepID=A0A841I117_9DEIO|nr:Ig-like domain-containing protein [Deinobacterium chartae]MBB6099491.1 hypothetical protein [Deinobacterium chartae]
MKTKTTGTLALTLILAACSSGGNPNPPPDTTPPTVLSIVPGDGTTGINKSADVVVTFSEKMDQASAQAAFQSANLPDGTFSWNAEGTVMTYNPNADLAYGPTGTNYSLNITTAAKDLAGNALAASVSSSFRTYRQVSSTFNSVTDLDGWVREDGNVNTALGLSGLMVGDSAAVDNASYRSFLTFDLSGLPASLEASNIVEAKLEVYQNDVVGTPYTDLDECSGAPVLVCTNIMVEHVNYGSSLTASDFDAAALLYVGQIGCATIIACDEVSLGYKTLTTGAMRDALADDWTNRAERGNRAQFRLRFAKQSDFDGASDIVYFNAAESASNKPRLVLTYLLP